ncbi:cation:proton antiporter [Pelomonas sp. Root1217]|uniref:Na+/H+ antiporter subunit E n=1 Tax=Pelomonas sp. Root1217 TaxID=1736430 RepID=UPI00070E2891|nr:Na+/H+ antiporter subunit E [Pelomonas sp. Root1217]KQV55007.1 cation:proton antiporter [Pelomonas sp. Root1217]
MKRWLPAPLLSGGLFALWLLLNQSLGLGQALLGAGVAVVMPLLMAPLRPAAGPLRQPRVLVRLILHVGADVMTSALDVAQGVLRAGRQAPRGRFVVVPLDLRKPHALAALAMITTVVPGTVWCELAPDRSALLLHVFDLSEEATFIAHFKARYEQPLLEIFG